jgi:hypothetical protein
MADSVAKLWKRLLPRGQIIKSTLRIDVRGIPENSFAQNLG